jgi:hypothetical protein
MTLLSTYLLIRNIINGNDAQRELTGTCIDAHDLNSVERLVRKMDNGKGTDEIMIQLSNLYHVFLPNEQMMRRLSLMHQQVSYTGNMHEFCVTCVYIAAMESLSNQLPQKMNRIQSESIIKYPKIRKTLSCWF